MPRQNAAGRLTGHHWIACRSNKQRVIRYLAGRDSAAPAVVRRLLYDASGVIQLMVRIVFGVMAFVALLVTYWVNPTAAWIVLGSSFTLAVAFKVRQREEAEGALQTNVADE